MAPMIRRKVSLGVVIGSRAFFSPAPCRAARDQVLAQLARLGIDAVTLPFEATANGAVQSVADADLYARHFRAQADRIDGLVICLPNFGDEIAISELVSRARLNVPILVQAANDEVDRVDVHSRRDAFCGRSASPTTSGNIASPSPKPRPIPATPTARRLAPIWNASPEPAAPCGACAGRGSGRSARAPAPSRPCAIPKSCCRMRA